MPRIKRECAWGAGIAAAIGPGQLAVVATHNHRPASAHTKSAHNGAAAPGQIAARGVQIQYKLHFGERVEFS